MDKLLQDVCLGKNLKQYRKALGLTQGDVCAQMGIKGRPMSQNTYSQIESGRRNIFVSDLVVLSQVLKVDFNKIFENIKPISKYSELEGTRE